MRTWPALLIVWGFACQTGSTGGLCDGGNLKCLKRIEMGTATPHGCVARCQKEGGCCWNVSLEWKDGGEDKADVIECTDTIVSKIGDGTLTNVACNCK